MKSGTNPTSSGALRVTIKIKTRRKKQKSIKMYSRRGRRQSKARRIRRCMKLDTVIPDKVSSHFFLTRRANPLRTKRY